MSTEGPTLALPGSSFQPFTPSEPATYRPEIYQSQSGSTQHCCDTGRPIMSDPVTGKTVCSCQLQTGTRPYLSSAHSLPEPGYTPTTSPAFPTSATVTTACEPSAFFRPAAGTYTGKISGGLSSAAPAPSYLPAMPLVHPYQTLYHGIDYRSAAQRRIPTRETTGPLKAWLKDHKKNPYPTKGEKVMLAMVTRMTLTQVSTWFANARRRMKKDKNLDWSSGDDDLTPSEKENTSKDADTLMERVPSRLSTSTDGHLSTSTDGRLSSSTDGHLSTSTDDDVSKCSSVSSSEDSEDEAKTARGAKKCLQKLFEPLAEPTGRPSDMVGNVTRSPDYYTGMVAPSSTHAFNTPSYQYSTRTSMDNHFNGSVMPPFSFLTGQSKDFTIPSTSTPIPAKEERRDMPRHSNEKKKIWSISEILG